MFHDGFLYLYEFINNNKECNNESKICVIIIFYINYIYSMFLIHTFIFS